MAYHNELLSSRDYEGNAVRMNGSFMKEAFLFNGGLDIVGIYSGFTGFSILEALKQDIGSNRVGNKATSYPKLESQRSLTF